VPAGSVDATSNPPADAKPEYTIFIKELHALHNELTLLLSPSTSPPCIIEDQPTPMTVVAIDDRDNTDHITAKLEYTASDPHEATKPKHITFFNKLEALHNELALLLPPSTPPLCTINLNPPTTINMNNNRDHTDHITAEHENSNKEQNGAHHNKYASTHHSNKNHDSDDRVNVDSDTADRKTDNCKTDKNQHDNQETDNQENAARNTNINDNDECTQYKSPQTWHRQQYMLTLAHTRQVTHPLHNSPADPASSATTTRELATTPMGSACNNSANLNNKQSPQQTQTDNKYDATLAQLWILLAQLEELNTQFALWLDTLTITKSIIKPKNTSGNRLHPPDPPTVNMTSILMSAFPLNNKHLALTPGETPATDPTGWMFL